MNYIIKFARELYTILTEMAPYLLFGFFLAGLLHLLIPKKKVRMYMGQNNFRSILNAALVGIPLPLCSCGVIPTSMSLYKHGATKASTVSFLITTPQTGADSIFVTYSLLGLPMAIIRPVMAFFTGLAGGLVTRKADPENRAEITDAGEEAEFKPTGFFPRIKEMLRYSFVEFLQDISTWLIIGLLIAALLSVLVPDEFFADKIPGQFAGMLAMLILSGPIYICATASVPVAAVLILKGFSPGAAFVLLMAGPATNAATITMIWKVLGKRSLFAFLGTVIAGSLITGFIIDTFLPPEWFRISAHLNHLGHTDSEILPGWAGAASAIILVLLIINGYLQKYLPAMKLFSGKSTTSGFSSGDVQTFKVSGMTCSNCKATVENSVKSSKGVDDAIADLVTGTVSIKGTSYDLDKIKSEIESIGYKILKD
jgi:uncharacterized membrane protein YraQ (UPF0718 family)/copper chaperone CopZ